MPERLNAGRVLAALGAVALFVSLFLDWYEPGFSAWTVFEVVDVLLAVIALLALLVSLDNLLGERRLRMNADRWLPALAAAALLLVLVSILNNPPAVAGRGEDVGAWIALAGAVAMAVGALLAERQISIVISSSPRASASTDRPSRSSTGPAFEPEGDESKTRPMNPVDK